MYKIFLYATYSVSYTVYSVSHFIQQPFSSNKNTGSPYVPDKWLGFKDWLNKKFCDKFMEINETSWKKPNVPDAQQKQADILKLQKFIEVGVDPKVLNNHSIFHEQVEISPKNQHLIDFLVSKGGNSELSSYTKFFHTQLMKAINKTFTATTLEEMQDGKCTIDYLLNQQVPEDEELEIVDYTSQNQQISNNKENISKKALGEAWLATVKLIPQQKFSETKSAFSKNTALIDDVVSDVINKFYKQDNSILHYTDNEGNNAMHILASSKVSWSKTHLLTILEELNKDCIDQLKLMVNKKGHNALQTAIVCKNSAIVYYLLNTCSSEQKESLLTTNDNNDNNPLHLAVLTNDYQVVHQILRKCSIEQKNNLFNALNTMGNTPIMEAIVNNPSYELEDKSLKEHYVELIVKFVQSCQRANIKRDFSRKVVLKQVLFLEARQYFINLMTSPQVEHKTCSFLKHIKNHQSISTMEKENLLIVQRLSKNISEADCMKLLKAAIKHNKQNVVSFLSKKVDINSLDSEGKSLLELTLGDYIEKTLVTQKMDMLRLLINQGADVDIQDSEGNTLLHKIVNMISLDGFSEDLKGYIIQYLIERVKADPNVKNEEDNTPLHLAFKNNDIKLFKKLIEVGANLSIPDAEGKTALDYVIKILDIGGQEQFITILDAMPGNVLSQYYDSMINKLPAKYSKIKEVINYKLMGKYPGQNDLSQIMQKQINPMMKGKIQFSLSSKSPTKSSISKELNSLEPWPSQNTKNFSNLIPKGAMEKVTEESASKSAKDKSLITVRLNQGGDERHSNIDAIFKGFNQQEQAPYDHLLGQDHFNESGCQLGGSNTCMGSDNHSIVFYDNG